jgi:hypothetical protein
LCYQNSQPTAEHVQSYEMLVEDLRVALEKIQVDFHFSDLDDFELVVTGNLANGNLVPDLKKLNKVECALLIPRFM